MTPESSAMRLASGSTSVRLGLAFAVFSLIFVSIAIHIGADEVAFMHRAQSTQATVVVRAIHRADTSGSNATRYILRYRFAAAPGKLIEDVVEVPVAQWEQVQEGSVLSVWYLPDRPDRHRLDPPGQWVATLVFGLVGIIFGSVGAALILGRVGKIRLVTRLTQVGLAAQGTVIRVADSGVRVNGIAQYRVMYLFVDDTGQRREGRSDLVAHAVAARWHAGDTGPVRYDPKDPSQSIWVPAFAATMKSRTDSIA